MNAALQLPALKQLPRGNFLREEWRIREVYGCSPLASKVWLAYARVLGCKSPLVEESLRQAIELGRRPLDNLHGQQARMRRNFTFGERLVREAIAREQRGERPWLRARQAGG